MPLHGYTVCILSDMFCQLIVQVVLIETSILVQLLSMCVTFNNYLTVVTSEGVLSVFRSSHLYLIYFVDEIFRGLGFSFFSSNF